MHWLSRFKTIVIWMAAAVTVIVSVPDVPAASLLAKQADEVAKRQATVDIDKKGGVQILLSLDADDLAKTRLEAVRGEISSLLRDARIGYTGLAASGRAARVRITDPTQVEAAKAVLKTLTDPVAEAGSVPEIAMDESEPALFKFTLTDAGIKHQTSMMLARSMEVIERRLGELGITAPVQQQGDDSFLVQAPGLQDTQRLKEILGKTAKLTFQMVDQSMSVQDALNGRPPAGSLVLYTQDDPPVPYLVENRVIVSDENLLDAQAMVSDKEPLIAFRLDSKGAARFGVATSQNVGKLFAIVLDHKVVSVPLIREPILVGNGQISGGFTPQGAKDIALMLRAGPLPAKLTIVEEHTIGSGLGQN